MKKNRFPIKVGGMLLAAAFSFLCAIPAFADTKVGDVLDPGKKVVFTVDLKKDSIEALGRMGITKLKKAQVGLWVPADFKPSRRWNVLLVSATDKASSISRMDRFVKAAKNVGGWIVMAADGTIRPDGKTDEVFECDTYRYAVMQAGLRALEAQWPAARNWPVAVGGFSGGAKRSGYMSVILMLKEYQLIGMWLGGCNEATPVYARMYNDPGERFLDVPVFLSGGDADEIATPSDVQEVYDILSACGFKSVRMKTYSGGHKLYTPHVEEGLRWFSAESGRPIYNIVFDANGGKGKMDDQTLFGGTAEKLRKNAFTRSGFVFAGWATSAGGAKKGIVAFKNAQKVSQLGSDAKTTLYAVWAKKSYKVKFYANGGKGKMAVQQFTYGKAKKLSKNKFKAPKGKKFAGWATSMAKAKKGLVKYKNKKKVKNLITTGKTVKLYAVWKKN